MESLLILSSDTQGLDPLGCDGVVWNATSGMRRRRRRPLEAALVESNLFHCVPFRAALVCSSGSSSADVIHSFVTALKKKNKIMKSNHHPQRPRGDLPSFCIAFYGSFLVELAAFGSHSSTFY